MLNTVAHYGPSIPLLGPTHPYVVPLYCHIRYLGCSFRGAPVLIMWSAIILCGASLCGILFRTCSSVFFLVRGKPHYKDKAEPNIEKRSENKPWTKGLDSNGASSAFSLRGKFIEDKRDFFDHWLLTFNCLWCLHVAHIWSKIAQEHNKLRVSERERMILTLWELSHCKKTNKQSTATEARRWREYTRCEALICSP